MECIPLSGQVFVTNNSTKSRAGYVKKFTSMGLDVKKEEIFGSAFAAAMSRKRIRGSGSALTKTPIKIH